MQGILLLLTFLPLAFLAVAAVVDSRRSLAVAAISSAASLAILASTAAFSSVNFSESFSYISYIPVSFTLRLIPASFILLIMSYIVLIAASVAGNHEKRSQKLAASLMLLLQVAATGLFLSGNLFLYFIFWDIGVVASFFFIYSLGSPLRKPAGMKFLIYEMLASVFLLLGIITIYFGTPVHSFDIAYIIAHAASIGVQSQILIFAFMILAFLVNMGIFPLHFWLPDAYTEASTQGSMVLSAILSKFGAFGVFLLFAMLPMGTELAKYTAVLGGISAFYAAFIMMSHRDVKRMISYTSILEMGIILIGLSSLNTIGTYGAVYAMLAHGLTIALMFLAAGSLMHVFGTRDIRTLSGAVSKAGGAVYSLVISTFAATGLPLTTGFVADLLIFIGAFSAFGIAGVVPLLAIVLFGAYMYLFIERSVLSTRKESEAIAHTGPAQAFGYALLVGSILFFGILPFTLLGFVNI